MIKIIQQGDYTLIETRRHIKIIQLDRDIFAWITVKDIGEILVSSHNPHVADHILAIGTYRIYEVLDEPKFTDLTHLELFIGSGQWQGYLLPTGLPTDKKSRSRIIPTLEIITKQAINFRGQ